MKKWVALCVVLAAAASIAACTQGTPTSTSIAPQSSTLISASGEARSNISPVLLCHKRGKAEPPWIVIEVDDNSVKFNGHLRHGDLTSSTCDDISTLHPGDDCSCCLEGGLHPCSGGI